MVALLNQLLSEADLAKLTEDQRDFLVQRIDAFLHDDDIRPLIAQKLQRAVNYVAQNVRVTP
jgi:hypothetical protein